MSEIRFLNDEAIGYYHLMSRTVNGEAWFGDREKEVLREMIWQVAEFSGIRVMTYAVMKNHFHLLVQVPPKETSKEISDREIVRRYRVLYPKPTPWQPMGYRALAKYLKNDDENAARIRESLVGRMHDVSWLMRTLKQRFSRWFNTSRKRFGPVWSERFKSVLVEGDSSALKTVAAYIDLNAVRAGLVSDPKDYRFCGYAEAVAGSEAARAGLLILDRDLAGYRMTLYGFGSEEKLEKKAIPREEALQVLSKGGKLPLSMLLRCKVRYLTEGKVLGSAEFVAEQLAREKASRKKPGVPKSMKGADWGELTVGKGCRKNLFG